MIANQLASLTKTLTTDRPEASQENFPSYSLLSHLSNSKLMTL